MHGVLLRTSLMLEYRWEKYLNSMIWRHHIASLSRMRVMCSKWIGIIPLLPLPVLQKKCASYVDDVRNGVNLSR